MTASTRVLARTRSALTFVAAALSLAILPAAHAEVSEIHVSRSTASVTCR